MNSNFKKMFPKSVKIFGDLQTIIFFFHENKMYRVAPKSALYATLSGVLVCEGNISTMH